MLRPFDNRKNRLLINYTKNNIVESDESVQSEYEFHSQESDLETLSTQHLSQFKKNV